MLKRGATLILPRKYISIERLFFKLGIGALIIESGENYENAKKLLAVLKSQKLKNL